MRVEARDRRSLCSLGASGLAAEMSFCLDLRERKGHGVRVTKFCESIDPGTAGIAEAEKLGDFVEGFACGVVDGAADECVRPRAVCWASEKKVGVATGDDQGEGLSISRAGCGRCGLSFLKEDRVDVAFEVIDGDQGEFVGESESFGVSDADE